MALTLANDPAYVNVNEYNVGADVSSSFHSADTGASSTLSGEGVGSNNSFSGVSRDNIRNTGNDHASNVSNRKRNANGEIGSSSSSSNSSVVSGMTFTQRKRHRPFPPPPPQHTSSSCGAACGTGNGDVYNNSNSSHVYRLNDLEHRIEERRRRQETFAREIKARRGLVVVAVPGDGNCLFRAVSKQVYGDIGMHGEVRKRCMDYMEVESDHFRPFVAPEVFEDYVARKRCLGVHGNNAEIQACSEIYNRPVEVYSCDFDSGQAHNAAAAAAAAATGGGAASSTSGQSDSNAHSASTSASTSSSLPLSSLRPINIFQSSYATSNAPIRVFYSSEQEGNHYDAIVDPYAATVGVGLGLPGFKPGEADRALMKRAAAESVRERVSECADADIIRVVQHRSWEEYRQQQEGQSSSSSSSSSRQRDDRSSRVAEINDDVLNHSATAATTSNPTAERSESGTFNFDPLGIHPRSPHLFHKVDATRNRSSNDINSNVGGHGRDNSRRRNGSRNASVGAIHPSEATAMNADSALLDTFPSSVQDLVMNGFPLTRVLRGYELFGDNFDAMLTFLLCLGNAEQGDGRRGGASGVNLNNINNEGGTAIPRETSSSSAAATVSVTTASSRGNDEGDEDIGCCTYS